MSASTTPTTQTAKKPHVCSWCGDRINAGESYSRWRWFSDGDASTVKMHPECAKAQDEDALDGNGEFFLFENTRGER